MQNETLKKTADMILDKKEQDNKLFSDILSQLNEGRTVNATLATELSSTRQELTSLRSKVEQNLETTQKSIQTVKDDVEALRTRLNALKTDMETVYFYTTKLDQRFTGSTKEADSNLIKVGKVLFDYSNLCKSLEDQQREKLKSEFESRLEKSLATIKEEEEKKLKELREKYDEFLKYGEEQKLKSQNIETNLLEHVNSRISEMDANTRVMLKELKICKTFENGEIVRTIDLLKNSILSRKKKDQDLLIQFSRMLDEAKQDMSEQIQQLNSKFGDSKESKKLGSSRKDPSFYVI